MQYTYFALFKNIYLFLSRLQKETEVLEKFLEDEKELQETKEYQTATQILSEAKEVLSRT